MLLTLGPNTKTQSVPDYIRKTKELVEAGIPQTQHDTDSLLSELSTPSGLDTFIQTAKEPIWINWLYEQKTIFNAVRWHRASNTPTAATPQLDYTNLQHKLQ